VEALQRCIHEKQQLLERIKRQMRSDVAEGIISHTTENLIGMAQDNLDACLLKLEQNQYYEAVHLFSRVCWNLGEFTGRSKLERSAFKSNPSSTL
jgi:hypothetical protein